MGMGLSQWEGSEGPPERCIEAMVIAQQLLRSMQLHLEPSRVVDPLTAYSYAGLACSFIHGDPSYALHVLCKAESISELPLLRKLVDSAVWFAAYPGTQLHRDNYRSGPATLFDAHIIADAIDRTLTQPDPEVQAVVGEAKLWQLPFVDTLEEYEQLAGPKPPVDRQRGYQRFLRVGGLKPPWVDPPGAAGGGPGLQVCFVMDCTGSMGSYIAAAKEQVIGIADALRETGQPVEMAFVAYRDYRDMGHLKKMEFTSDIAELKAFIGRQKAEGGGDTPEDMVGGLKMGMEGLDWKPHMQRFVVLTADAPCHGTQYHKEKDDYPDGGVSGAPEPVLRRMKASGVKLIVSRVHRCIDQMVGKFEEIYPELAVIDMTQTSTSVFGELITQQIMASNFEQL